MDTQEQYKFAFTKKINWQGTHGCSKDNDRLFQLTDPNRISFHYPRSNHQHYLLSKKCSTIEQWKDTGYQPYNKNIKIPITVADPNYFIAQDIDHAGFNQFPKLFCSLKELKILKTHQLQVMYIKMVDMCKKNALKTKITWDNCPSSRSESSGFTNLTLESSQIGLVKYNLTIYNNIIDIYIYIFIRTDVI